MLLRKKIESRALRASALGYLFMALLGGLFFYLAQSQAILLDGVYSFISLLMTFLAQRVSRLPAARSTSFVALVSVWNVSTMDLNSGISSVS